MIKLPFELCSGCAACLNICPVNAILMQEDEYGFIHAKINKKKCVKCHLCEKTCPVYVQAKKNDPFKVIAAVCKDNDVQETSASAGVSYFLCKKILEERGTVYGCSQKNYFTIGHERIDKIEDLCHIQNSKYVQSDIGYTMQQVKSDLVQGKKVVFTGSPCHIAGLRNFLKKDYENLLTIDLVCHGVPPMRMLREQIETDSLLKPYNPSEIHVDFRWKTIQSGCLSIRFGLRYAIHSGGHYIYINEENDILNPYMRCFQTGISLRDSCLKCLYATKGRVSDITLADFWGLGSSIPSEMNAQRGVSLVLINTEKGLKSFNEIKDNFDLEEHSFEEASQKNQCLSRPFPILPQRQDFLRLYKERGLRYAAKTTDRKHKFETNWIIRNLRKNKFTNLSLRILLRLNSLRKKNK